VGDQHRVPRIGDGRERRAPDGEAHRGLGVAVWR
jgi:hypothetical protein